MTCLRASVHVKHHSAQVRIGIMIGTDVLLDCALELLLLRNDFFGQHCRVTRAIQNSKPGNIVHQDIQKASCGRTVR
jgi:hypothetical protein